MAQANAAKKEQYPFATQEGNAIPFDIGQPLAVAFIDFTAAPTALVDLPEGTEVISIETLEACVVSFGAVVPALVVGTFFNDCVKIPAGSVIQLAVNPEVRRKAISVVRAGAVNGTIWVQCYRTWRALKQQTKSQ